MQNSFTCVSVRVCATGLNTYSHYCSSTRKAVPGKYLIRKQANQEKSPWQIFCLLVISFGEWCEKSMFLKTSIWLSSQ